MTRLLPELLAGLVFGLGAGVSFMLTCYLIAETERLWRKRRQR